MFSTIPHGPRHRPLVLGHSTPHHAQKAQVRRECRAHCITATRSSTLTQRIFEEIEERGRQSKQAGGSGGGTTYKALQGADAAWSRIRNMPTGAEAGPAPVFVREPSSPMGTFPEFDVLVCGGTLGIFLACALQAKGLRVAVLERGPLEGRAQEWNISRKELDEIVAAGVLAQEEVDECIAMEFNPVRIGFKGAKDVWTRDVLNLGVSPDKLIRKVSARFKNLGGTIIDRTPASGVTVHPDGVSVAVTSDSRDRVTAKLVVDSMGHASPIVRQIRHGKKPDGVCLVVGTMARGFPEELNRSADVIYTNRDLEKGDSATAAQQYFWEAFPAGSGRHDRTTYLFTYLDADPRRPSLEEMLDDYWRLMPQYQGVKLEDLEVQRILFGCFPTYRDSPLRPAFDRVLQVGDASGIQSPLSFGGFGALSRHIHRLTSAIHEAVEAGAVDRKSLALINAYNPGLSAAWMLQRAMSVRYGQDPPPQFVNKLLGASFGAMESKGQRVMKPFLQDVIQFGPFALTLIGQMFSDPGVVPQIMRHVGAFALLDWLRHFIALGLFDLGHRVVGPLLKLAPKPTPKARYATSRYLDALKYGSGNDYVH